MDESLDNILSKKSIFPNLIFSDVIGFSLGTTSFGKSEGTEKKIVLFLKEKKKKVIIKKSKTFLLNNIKLFIYRFTSIIYSNNI